MTDAFHHSLVRKIVALQCKEAGFQVINGDALEELTILYMQYFLLLLTRTKHYAELGQRTKVNMNDLRLCFAESDISSKELGLFLSQQKELFLPLKKLSKARNPYLDAYTYPSFEYTAKDEEPMPILCPLKPSPHSYQLTRTTTAYDGHSIKRLREIQAKQARIVQDNLRQLYENGQFSDGQFIVNYERKCIRLGL